VTSESVHTSEVVWKVSFNRHIKRHNFDISYNFSIRYESIFYTLSKWVCGVLLLIMSMTSIFVNNILIFVRNKCHPLGMQRVKCSVI